MRQPNLLEINDLRIYFTSNQSEVRAVRGISFHLKKGETLGIVGESGSGKSATALALMGLLPTAGRIVNGKIIFNKNGNDPIDLATAKPAQLQQVRGGEIAMVFQEPMTSLNPVFRCGHQVVEAILKHQNTSKSKAKQQALNLFQKVKLADPKRIFQSYPHQLSGGQRQRVMIAMALSCNPSVLIADEPTSALDVTVQRSILDLVKELKQEWGGATIFISHDLGVVAEVADRVLVMQHGKIVEEGSTVEVFRHAKHEYTKGLLRDSKYLSFGKAGTNRPPAQKPILKITNLSTWFSTKKTVFGKTTEFVKAVDEVSFKIHEGETLGLVGESGSGKTTLGRTILHLQNPTGGSVVYDGKNLHDLPTSQWKNVRKDLQVIFQDPYSSLNPKMMVGKAIEEPMKVHGIGGNDNERHQMTLQLLEKVGLEAEHYWRFPKEFSGGQRQRICIARALALKPRFIVCDECVSALDVTVQAKILKLLKQLQDEFNLTYLFISHDLALMRQIADRIAVMKDGKIVEMGPTQDIYSKPRESYTRQLIEAIPNMP